MTTGLLDRSPADAPSGRNVPRISGMWWKVAAGCWMTLSILAAFLYVRPAVQDGVPSFSMHGNGAKIIFFHVPCAWLACWGYVVASWFAAQHLVYLRRGASTSPSRAHWAPYLGLAAMAFLAGPGAVKAGALPALLGLAYCTWRPDARSDYASAVGMELGLVFAFLATVTGSIFSHNEWGAYWSWDPRQTSIVVILLIFAAYVVLRGAVIDPRVRGRVCAAYSLIAVVPALFLIWVLPRIVETLHSGPNQAVVGGGLGGGYKVVLWGLMLPAFFGLFAWMHDLGVRFKRVEERAERVV